MKITINFFWFSYVSSEIAYTERRVTILLDIINYCGV